VESDLAWINKIQPLISNLNKCKFIYIDINSNGNWGNPGKNATSDQCKKYSDAITTIGNLNIDLILIDGRFRVACALKCFNLENCLILFDDFLNRAEYSIILKFYDIVEHGEIMVCLRKKSVDAPPLDLVKKYELIPY
jgi:hypothetical protein